MMRFIRQMLILFPAVSCFCQDASARSVLTIDQEAFPPIVLTEDFDITAQQGFDAASIQDASVPFQAMKDAALSSTEAVPHYWLRLTIHNTTGRDLPAILVYPYAIVSSIEIYQSEGGQNRLVTAMGTSHPIGDRHSRFRKPNVRLPLTGGLSTFYVKVTFTGVKPPYFTLMRESDFTPYSNADTLIIGLCFGALLFAFLYNCFVYLQLRYTYFLPYILFSGIGIFAFSLFSGFLLLALPDGDHSRFISMAISSASAFTLAIMGSFTSTFLQLKEHSRRIHRWTSVLTGLFIVLGLWIVIEQTVAGKSYYTAIAQRILSLFGLLSYLAGGVTALRRAYRPALFYLLAWLPTLGGTVAAVLVIDGTFGWHETADLWPGIGTAFQVCLLSLALGHRVKMDTNRLHAELENHIHRLDELVAEKTSKITYILDNVDLGIFRFDRNRRIDVEFSQACVTIFDQPQIAGLKVEDLLFERHANAATEEQQIISSVLEAFLGEDAFAYELNVSNLPHEITLRGSGKIVSLDWKPIIVGGLVEGCLVTSRDITYTRKLEEDKRKTAEEINLLRIVGKTGLDRIIDYIEAESQLIRKTRKACLALAQVPPESQRLNLALCLRNLHTIKGNARTYGFDEASRQVHECETQVKHAQNTGDKAVAILAALDGLDRFCERCLQVINTYIPQSKRRMDKDSAAAAACIRKLESIKNLLPPPQRGEVVPISDFIRKQAATSFAELLQPIIADLPRIAGHLGKQAPELVIRGPDLFLDQAHAHPLRSVLIHIVRNAIDHGIESAEERLSRGKPSQGRILFRSVHRPGCVELVCEDDGRGLALQQIHARARAMGLVDAEAHPTIGELADLIFLSGFSSKEEQETSEFSGRGVGMDAVKEYLAELDAKVRIEFLETELRSRRIRDYPGSHAPFRLVMGIPLAVFLSSEAS